MRKVAVARCAFVVLTLSMLAVSGADKTVTNKELGFEITFPESWGVKNERELGTAGYFPNGERKRKLLGISVDASKAKPGTSLETLMNNEIAELGKTSQNFQVVAKGSVKLGAVDATMLSGTSEDKVLARKYKSVRYFVLVGDRALVLWASGTTDEYDLYAKDIDAIVKSFKLIEAK